MPSVGVAEAVDELKLNSRNFAEAASANKLALLSTICDSKPSTRLAARTARDLHNTLLFLRAYPDSPAQLRAVDKALTWLRNHVEGRTAKQPDQPGFLNQGIPGASNSYIYSYGVLQRLVRIFPGALSIDWDNFEDPGSLYCVAELLLSPAEAAGLDDDDVEGPEWFEQFTPPGRTDLEALLELFENSSLSEPLQIHLYESCEVPCVYRLQQPGAARGEVRHAPRRIHYQRAAIDRDKFPLAPRITKPLPAVRPLPAREGEQMLDMATIALCSRNLEIFPLICGNKHDVRLVDCGRGLQVMLAGVKPKFREPLEALFFFLVLKNGVPIAYGPASSFLGCCEMGINLFPEFRGGEIRHIYAEFMRALYHLADVRYFFVTAYGMGENNEDALKSGAFWFYRKLGFAADNPRVDALARAEEEIMRRDPTYRCSRAMLRKLSHTSASFDLSRGTCKPLRFGPLGLAATQLVAERFQGNRALATKRCTVHTCRVLGIDDFRQWNTDQKGAMHRISPLIAAIPDLGDWSRRDRKALGRMIRAKGGRNETQFIRLAYKHPRFGAALRSLAGDP